MGKTGKLVLTSSRWGKQEFCCNTEKSWKQRKNTLITFDIYFVVTAFSVLTVMVLGENF